MPFRIQIWDGRINVIRERGNKTIAVIRQSDIDNGIEVEAYDVNKGELEEIMGAVIYHARWLNEE